MHIASREYERVKLTLKVRVPYRMAKAVAKAVGPELGKGVARAERDCLLIEAKGLTISEARALLNSHLRVLKAAIDSIRAIDSP